MSLQNQQNLLAKLYTDAELRRAFLSDPAKIGAANDLTEAEIGEIAAVMPDELEFFADSLFWKRLREAEKFLPLTKRFLGDEFTGLFRVFSQGYNPQSIKKHFEDALEFSRFLSRQNIADAAADAARFEKAKLEFFGFEKTFAVCRLNFDFSKVSLDGQLKSSNPLVKKKKIAVWVRTGKRVRHFFI